MTVCPEIECQSNPQRNARLTFSVGIVPVLSAVLLSLSTPASATATASPTYTADIIPRERVRLDDLDLHTAAGWHTAQRRLQRAAARVCSMQPTGFAAARCREDSMTRAEGALVRQSGVQDVATETDAAGHAPIRG